jgi:hypothetical protein
MSEQPKTDQTGAVSDAARLSQGIAVGVAIGCALGVAMGDIAIGLGLGIAIGAGFGALPRRQPPDRTGS